MIGYLVEQELTNAMPAGSKIATLLTQIEVDRDDPAFSHAEKPIGPVYTQDEAVKAKEAYGWPMVEEAEGRWRRVVPSPLPQHITQIETIRLLVEAGVTVICAGGGGIPVMREADGTLRGLEAVIDKDRAACLLAKELGADAFLMLPDVDAVYEGWGTADKRPIGKATPTELNSDVFAAGSMRPKVEAACDFANAGGISGIGRLEDARGILEGRQGTLVTLQAINQAS